MTKYLYYLLEQASNHPLNQPPNQIQQPTKKTENRQHAKQEQITHKPLKHDQYPITIAAMAITPTPNTSPKMIDAASSSNAGVIISVSQRLYVWTRRATLKLNDAVVVVIQLFVVSHNGFANRNSLFPKPANCGKYQPV